MDSHETTTLSLVLEVHLVGNTFSVLQRGFLLKTKVGCSIETFLREHCGLDPGYIKTRISTVLLDGKPIDDMGSAILLDGSTLALSGAMPGLVGAVMRSGSYYAPFRGSILYRKSDGNIQPKEGMIKAKLFNTVMTELGAEFLRRGIVLKSTELRDFLIEQPETFWRGCKKMMLNNNPIKPNTLREERVWSGSDLVLFSINPDVA